MRRANAWKSLGSDAKRYLSPDTALIFVTGPECFGSSACILNNCAGREYWVQNHIHPSHWVTTKLYILFGVELNTFDSRDSFITTKANVLKYMYDMYTHLDHIQIAPHVFRQLQSIQLFSRKCSILLTTSSKANFGKHLAQISGMTACP